MLYSTYTAADDDKRTFDLWSAVTDVVQPSKGFTDEIYGHAVTLRLRTCFKYGTEKTRARAVTANRFGCFFFISQDA